ncbi:MAG: hypothetical protein PHU44_00520 [Syntrophales bacterium]|nr:hypothetical protein [Syntrophales bacterium]MDD5643649.1 hypothetical protein [Syntrophales bacterium]
MIGIRERIDGALFLWKNGRAEGALLSVLIAVAATARLRYPKMKDRECFEQFLRDTRLPVMRVEYRGECHPFEHIFYKWLRCQLVHEGGLPLDIQFIGEDEPNSMSVRAGGAPEYILKIGYGWFNHMVGCVILAPENSEHFRKDERSEV